MRLAGVGAKRQRHNGTVWITNYLSLVVSPLALLLIASSVSEQMVINAAMQMENQVKYGLIRMKEQYITDNVKHVFENVPESVRNTGRRFSWSHHSRMTSRRHSLKELDAMRRQFEEAEKDL